jgi:hypothetical protein
LLLRWSKLERLRFYQVFALIFLGYLLLLAHALIYALGGLLGMLVFLSQGPKLVRRMLRVAYLGAAAPLTLLWVLWTNETSAQVQDAIQFRLSWSRIGFLGSDMVGLPPGAVYSALGWLAIALPWFQGARFARPPHRWAPLVLVLGIFAFGPSIAFGSHFVASRFALFVVPFYLFALDSSPTRSRNALAYPPVLITFFATFAFASWARDAYRFTQESASYQAVRAKLERGKKALYLPFARGSEFSRAPAYLHFGSYYTAENLGDVDFNFAQFFNLMVRIKEPSLRPIGSRFSFVPGEFDWQTHRGDNYDYFIVRSEEDVTSLILKNAPGRALDKLAHDGSWWLFQVRPASERSAAPIPTSAHPTVNH